jgi:hypothetical protein
MLYKIRIYETCMIPAWLSNCICSSVAPMNRKPEAYSKNGVRYWKLFGLAPLMLTLGLSRRTNEISMIRVRPAAIRV